MYNLIISMMSVVLMGMMSMAALSYAGVIFSEKSGENAGRSQAVTLMTNAQQVAGAQRAYMIQNSGNLANSYQVLIDGDFLRAVPGLPVEAVIGGWAMSPDGRVSMIPLSLNRNGKTGSAADRICELLPEFGGGGFIPAVGADPAISDFDGSEFWFGCVTNPGAASIEAATQVWFAHRT